MFKGVKIVMYTEALKTEINRLSDMQKFSQVKNFILNIIHFCNVIILFSFS